MTASIKRTPAGTPTGGQFASHDRPDAVAGLDELDSGILFRVKADVAEMYPEAAAVRVYRTAADSHYLIDAVLDMYGEDVSDEVDDGLRTLTDTDTGYMLRLAGLRGDTLFGDPVEVEFEGPIAFHFRDINLR